jgi:hypothetical protein
MDQGTTTGSSSGIHKPKPKSKARTVAEPSQAPTSIAELPSSPKRKGAKSSQPIPDIQKSSRGIEDAGASPGGPPASKRATKAKAKEVSKSVGDVGGSTPKTSKPNDGQPSSRDISKTFKPTMTEASTPKATKSQDLSRGISSPAISICTPINFQSGFKGKDHTPKTKHATTTPPAPESQKEHKVSLLEAYSLLTSKYDMTR